jgi:flagellar basal body P-ring formation protein FlgA
MRRIVLAHVLVLISPPVAAEVVVASRTIRPQTIIAATDVALRSGDMPGAAAALAEVVGREARIAIYAGRPVMRADTGPPAVVERNQLVVMHYVTASLTISADGRALGRAAIGERVRVMNLDSRATVLGTVRPDGSITVSPQEHPG